MTTWQDVARIRNLNPTWGCAKIAQHLGCRAEYVRATFQRRGWANPNSRDPALRASAAAHAKRQQEQANEFLGKEPDIESGPPAHVTDVPSFGRVVHGLSDRQIERAARRANPWLD